MKKWFKGLLTGPVRKGIRTATQVFVAAYSVTLLGFLGQVAEWSSASDKAFPSMNPLGKGAVSAFIAAVSGLVAVFQNWSENKTGKSFLIASSPAPLEATPGTVITDMTVTQAPVTSTTAVETVEATAVKTATVAIDEDVNDAELQIDDKSYGGFVDDPGGSTVTTDEDFDESYEPPIVMIHEPDPQVGYVSENEQLCNSPYQGKRCVLPAGHGPTVKHERV
jgi:hypothetical protein